MSDESYEWLPGGFFVLHRWDAQTGKHPFKGAEVMGYDETEGGYFTRMFDNAGHHPEYRASVERASVELCGSENPCHGHSAGQRR